uniref:phosphoribosylformylglycinamidine cyclo-ligase n=2 Tax=Hirondellea gigas TaxID=1518452 RepID=A0A2P2IBX8_9CRUS
MGAYAPSGVSGKLLDTIKRTIIKPTIDGLRKEGNPFVGVLFAGIMLTVDGPKVLEFNCRMGDPETQVILPLIKSDFYELVSSCADGCLDAINVEFWPKCACAVVAASGGYPGSYTKGKRIVGLETVDSENVIVSHAGTQRLEDDSGIVTSGGRVLAVTGIGNTMNDAIRLAYEGISKVKFENIHFRTDIAHSYAVEEKVSCTYADSGVNTEVGDCASKIAYNGAKATFSSRKGMIGEPIQNDGGFTGFLDFGDFCLVQGDDGVGTKIIIADAMNKYDTLGADLLAMVCDDAVCVGAETISISNTIDTNCVDPHRISEMMKGLTKACCEQKIVIPGGEIAELGNQLNSSIWNSTAVGIVAKDRIISGKDIQIGDTIIALRENGFRSNGFSLVRLILREHFQSSDLSSILSRKFSYPESSSPTQTYGEALLHPSTIYSSAILDIIGRYSERTSEKTVTLKGIVHVTGGGIPGNFYRILPNNSGFGAELTNLFSPSPVMLKIQTLGNVSDLEAYKTWNMGNGMLVVVSPADSSNVLQLLKGSGIDAQVAGTIIPGGKIRILSKGVDSPGFVLEFGK